MNMTLNFMFSSFHVRC